MLSITCLVWERFCDRLDMYGIFSNVLSWILGSIHKFCHVWKLLLETLLELKFIIIRNFFSTERRWVSDLWLNFMRNHKTSFTNDNVNGRHLTKVITAKFLSLHCFETFVWIKHEIRDQENKGNFILSLFTCYKQSKLL